MNETVLQASKRVIVASLGKVFQKKGIYPAFITTLHGGRVDSLEKWDQSVYKTLQPLPIFTDSDLTCQS